MDPIDSKYSSLCERFAVFITRPVIFLVFIFLFFLPCAYAQKTKIDSLQNALNKAKADTDRVNILNLMSAVLADKSSSDSAMKYAIQAKKLGEKTGYKRGLAQAFGNIGIVNLNQGNFEEALNNNLQSLKIKQETGDLTGTADSYTSMGNIYEYQGNFVEAMQSYFAALKIEEQNGTNKSRIAADYGNIGIVYARQKNFPEALKNIIQALDIFKQTDNKRSIAICYSNLGNIYNGQGDAKEALKNYSEALKIQTQLNDRLHIAITCNNMGVIYSAQRNYSEALKDYSIALEIYNQMGDKRRIAMSYENIGELYTKQGKYREAKKYLIDAMELEKKIGAKDFLKDSYDGLAKLAEATKDYKGAYTYHKLFSDVKDSLLNESNNEQVAEMKTKYETEKKDKEIAMLNKDKELLNKDNEIQAVRIDKQKTTVRYIIAVVILLSLLAWVSIYLNNKKKKATFLQQVTETKMKALRAQMNPHFIYNSINSVYRYMQENDLRSAEAYLLSFAKLIRQVLENSLQNEVSLNEELRSLELYLGLESQRMNNKFAYKINVADDVDRENTLVPPLLMEPFVENSIWHGLRNKEGQGKITINIVKDGDMLKCTIEDNGVGRRHAEIKTPVQGMKKQSLGMKLTEDRIATMNQIIDSKAAVSIIDLFDEMQKPAGVKVELSLPLLFND